MKDWVDLHRAGKCNFESHFIANAGNPEGARFFIIRLFTGKCSGQISTIQIDKFTDFEGVRNWELSTIRQLA
jgi:hypothetical protein